MMRAGFIGWRGMVGSVLMQRMLEERDFDYFEASFFTTSQAGGKGPDIGRPTQPLEDARDIAALARHDVLVSCQGGDYTNDIHPKLRTAGWFSEYRSSIAADRIVASGFATPLPAMSGADPWIGS